MDLDPHTATAFPAIGQRAEIVGRSVEPALEAGLAAGHSRKAGFISTFERLAEGRSWVGGAFDPDDFDLRNVNRMLQLFQSSLAG